MSIKVAVIGMGQMGTHHANNYLKIPQVELYACCEWNDKRRAEVAEEYGCKVFKDYKECLADPEIDAVSIVLPDNMHREAVEYAVKYGKHILLEKPLAKELEDGKALYELTKDYDRVFTVGFLLRYDYRFAAIKEALDKGELGDIIHIYARRNSPIVGPRRYIGASDLSMHVMIHDIDYINWFMNCRPVSVFAKGRSVLLAEHGMKDVIYAIVTYENGAIANLEACWVLPENSPTIIDDRCEIVTTNGVAYVEPCDKGIKFVTPQKILYPDSRHWNYVNGLPQGDLSEEIMGFINCVVSGRKPVVNVEEAYLALQVVDAIERSMKEGREVTL